MSVGLAVLLVMLIGNLTAFAQPAATPADSHAPVMANGRTLFQISGATQAAANKRAQTINRRLELLIARQAPVDRFQPADVLITEGAPLITLGAEPIMSVTNDDVADNLIAAPELAQLWGGQLSNAVQAARIARTGALSDAFIVLVTSTADMVRSVIKWSPRLLGVLLLALLFWPLARLARWVARCASRASHIDSNLAQLSIALAFYGVWGLGLLSMLSAVGVNSAGIAAAVGASGFILGFAFQDVLSHFLAGMLLLLGRQFYMGSQIKVGEHEGTVESIDLRATYLLTNDNRQVAIPNGQVFKSAVEINTANAYRRREFSLGIGYQVDTRSAIELAAETLRSVEGVLKVPSPQVLVSELGPAVVKLRLLVYTSNTNPDPMATMSECIMLVKEAYEKAEVSFVTIAPPPKPAPTSDKDTSG